MTQKHSIDPHNVIARSEGPSYQELLDREPVAAPGSLREDTVPYLGSENIPFDRYLRRAFHDREVEKLWPKSWLMVCRESQLPNPGDYLSYDITRYSSLVVRSPSGVSLASGTTSAPSSAIRATTIGSFSATRSAALNFSVASLGVPLGA